MNIERWKSANRTARRILKSSGLDAGASVCLIVDMVLSTSIELLEKVSQKLTGPLIYRALFQRLATPVGRVHRTAKSVDFASAWEIEDRASKIQSRAMRSDRVRNARTETSLVAMSCGKLAMFNMRLRLEEFY